jgi:hypothetical protein
MLHAYMANQRQIRIIVVCSVCLLVTRSLHRDFNTQRADAKRFNFPAIIQSNDQSFTNISSTPEMLFPNLNSVASFRILSNISIANQDNVTTRGPTAIGKKALVDDANMTRNDCFQFNTNEWLRGPRVGNIQVTDEWLEHMLHPTRLLTQPHLDTILDQTLCYQQGRFRNLSQHQHWNASDADQILDWAFRLLYLVIHRRLHEPAFLEYQQRRKCGLLESTTLSDNPPALPFGLGNFDYECPNAKFLVTVLNTTAGMGSVVKNGIVPSIYMAFVTGRIPLFFQSVRGDGLPNLLREKLPLASCDRGDWQCVFLPTSPCVLSLENLRNATILNPFESRDLKQRGYLKNILNETRVLISGTFPLVPIHAKFSIHNVLRERAYEAIQELLWEWQKDDSRDDAIPEDYWELLQAAAASFAVPYSADETSQSRKWRYLRAALLYAIRPNSIARQAMDQQINKALPKRTDNRQYFGVPIRGKNFIKHQVPINVKVLRTAFSVLMPNVLGSDKCALESTCLSFDRYMELVLAKWRQHGIPNKRGTVLLTSEDPHILPLRLNYAQNKSFPLDFVVNLRDAQPGTGDSANYRNQADAIMISSLVVLKLQLFSNVLIGNCCSNFHGLLFDLVREGCGADPDMNFECLNEMEDPRFRICCGWTKEGLCQQVWEDHAARLKLNNTDRYMYTEYLPPV